MDEQVGAAICAQITQTVIQKLNNESFQVKLMNQILWTNGECYELQEILGLVDSAEVETEANEDNADDKGKECVTCLSEPRNTMVLPCRHMVRIRKFLFPLVSFLDSSSSIGHWVVCSLID